MIAEKFEALVRLDVQNSRMKDFFDLDFLLADESHDPQAIGDAIRATFKRRCSILPMEPPVGLTEEFANERQNMWNAFLRKNGLKADEFAQVVGRIRTALAWIWKE